MDTIPDRFPTVMVDRIINVLGYAVELMIQLEMEFAHRLDVKRLARALELMLDAEPILGCRFVAHPLQFLTGLSGYDGSLTFSTWVLSATYYVARQDITCRKR